MKRLRRILASLAVASLVAACGGAAFVYLVPFPEELLARDRVTPVEVRDRKGRLLRQGLSSDGTRGCWTPLPDLSPWLVTATLVAEDRRFRDHEGVDLLAAARALRDNVRWGRRVSGASTLTMQLVRLLRPRPRTWRSKIEESVLALRLERRLSKDGILEEYLNRAPYGSNFVGVEAGALRSFGKPARDLSPAEAALLAGLPQSPARLDPIRFPERARRRQRWILDEMRRLGHLGAEEHRGALEEAALPLRAPIPFEAETYVDWVLRPGDRSIPTTLDLELQREMERLVKAAGPHLQRCGASESAVAVVDNPTGEIRAFVGPAGRRRSPGSALKPFVYALALESGRTAASMYDDKPVHFETPTGDYSPRNYDGRFYGPVTLRQALANSLNVPAVLALREEGLGRFVSSLRSAGLEGIDPDPRRHGLGLVIGDARCSPVELARAYATLARGAPSAETAYVISDILSDDAARALAFGTGSDLSFDFRVAAKTGTSPDHRDNWVAGYTREWTAVVWVGNADARPLRGTSGLEGAGPIFRAVMSRLRGGWFPRPPGLVEETVCAETGQLPGPGCGRTISERFPAARAPRTRCSARAGEFRVDTPQPWDRFALDSGSARSTRFLRFRSAAGLEDSLEWRVNGDLIAVTTGLHEVDWPASRGRFELRVRCGEREIVRRFEVR